MFVEGGDWNGNVNGNGVKNLPGSGNFKCYFPGMGIPLALNGYTGCISITKYAGFRNYGPILLVSLNIAQECSPHFVYSYRKQKGRKTRNCLSGPLWDDE